MDVKVTEHVIEPTPPPKTYDVEFKGLTLDEYVVLRAALSTSTYNRHKLTDSLLERFTECKLDFYSAIYLVDEHLGRIACEGYSKCH